MRAMLTYRADHARRCTRSSSPVVSCGNRCRPGTQAARRPKRSGTIEDAGARAGRGAGGHRADARSSGPKSVIRPADGRRRSRHLASMSTVSELVAARLLVAYHLEHQRPMMGAFLDAVGIAHEQGMIADEEGRRPPGRGAARRGDHDRRGVSGRGRGALLGDAAVAGRRRRGARWPTRPRPHAGSVPEASWAT